MRRIVLGLIIQCNYMYRYFLGTYIIDHIVNEFIVRA